MQQRSWTYWVVAVLAVVAGGLAVAFAGGHDASRQRVEIVLDGAEESYELEDFADGETRTFAAGDHEVTVTRRGDRLEVTLDGKPVGGPDPSFHGHGSGPMVWITDDDEEIDLGGGDGFKYMFITREEGEGKGDEDRVVVKIKKHVVTSKDGEGRVLLAGPGHFGHDLVVDPDATVFRCTADGTTLKVANEKATEAGFTCPVCGLAMEKLEGAHMKVIEIHRVEEEPERD